MKATTVWNDLLYRCRAFFRRKAVEAELDEEIRFHLERQIEKLTRAGVAPVPECESEAHPQRGWKARTASYPR